jgi:hypothetical protein
MRRIAWQTFWKSGKFQRFGKSRHCCGLTGWTEQSLPFKKNAFAVGLFGQGQSTTVGSEAHILLDEFVFGHSFERREPGQFSVFEMHLAGPATTRRAALAFVENGHRWQFRGLANGFKAGRNRWSTA